VTDRDKEKDKDWDHEMREVNRLLAKLPEADPGLVSGRAPTLRKPVPAAAPGTSPAGPTGAEWLGAWARVTLGLLVGAAMTQWPNAHECGFTLLSYGVGVATVLATGVWSSIASWKRRLAVAHVLSLLLIIWGLALAAREVLPRVGYASTPAEWLCP
jgi:hypothetical protein